MKKRLLILLLVSTFNSVVLADVAVMPGYLSKNVSNTDYAKNAKKMWSSAQSLDKTGDYQKAYDALQSCIDDLVQELDVRMNTMEMLNKGLQSVIAEKNRIAGKLKPDSDLDGGVGDESEDSSDNESLVEQQEHHHHSDDEKGGGDGDVGEFEPAESGI